MRDKFLQIFLLLTFTPLLFTGCKEIDKKEKQTVKEKVELNEPRRVALDTGLSLKRFRRCSWFRTGSYPLS